MRVAILVENYKDYYTLELRRNRALRRCPYREQVEALYARSYYQSDSYAYARCLHRNRPCARGAF